MLAHVPTKLSLLESRGEDTGYHPGGNPGGGICMGVD